MIPLRTGISASRAKGSPCSFCFSWKRSLYLSCLTVRMLSEEMEKCCHYGAVWWGGSFNFCEALWRLLLAARPGAWRTCCCHAQEDNEANKNAEASMSQTRLRSSPCCPVTPGRPLHLVEVLGVEMLGKAESELIWLLLQVCWGSDAYCIIVSLLRQGPSLVSLSIFLVSWIQEIFVELNWVGEWPASPCGNWVRWPERYYGFLWDRVQVEEWNEAEHSAHDRGLLNIVAEKCFSWLDAEL